MTFACPGVVNERFFKDDWRIVIYEGEKETCWYLWASSDERLKRLAEMVWRCPTLREGLVLEREGLREWEYMFPDENYWWEEE